MSEHTSDLDGDEDLALTVLFFDDAACGLAMGSIACSPTGPPRALSKSAIYARKVAGTLPTPLRFGRNRVRWRATSIRDWIDQQAAQ